MPKSLAVRAGTFRAGQGLPDGFYEVTLRTKGPSRLHPNPGHTKTRSSGTTEESEMSVWTQLFRNRAFQVKSSQSCCGDHRVASVSQNVLHTRTAI